MSDDYKFQFSIKTPSGSMLNVRADDEAELSEGLDVAGRQLVNVAGIEEIVAAMNNIYNGLSPQATIANAEAGAPPINSAGPAPAWAGAPQAAQQAAPAGGGKMCQHGEMVFRTGGGGATGKREWKGYFCPTAKGTIGQCSPEFIR